MVPRKKHVIVDRIALRNAIQLNQVEWKIHANIRRAERNIDMNDVLQAILEGEVYPDDPLAQPPKYKFVYPIKGKKLFVVLSFDQELPIVNIITVYYGR